MGILADVFVATTADALRYEEVMLDKGDMSAFERVESKGFTSLELGTLWAIIDGVEWDVDRHMLTTVKAADEGETWLEQFPDALVASLAALTESSIPKIADAWGKTEELQCSGTELRPIIQDLRRLAQSSRRSGKRMFLWGSL